MQVAQTISNWAVGQKVQILECNGIYVIDRFQSYSESFKQAYVTKLKRDGSRSKWNTSVNLDKLMTIDAKQPTVNKNGLTAEQYAKEAFKAGIVMHDYCRTTCQSLMQVISISKAGRVKVQPLHIIRGTKYDSKKVDGQIIRSQELQTINWMNLEYKPYGEPQNYSPSLHDGEWGYWKGEGYIKPAGMKLEQLLD